MRRGLFVCGLVFAMSGVMGFGQTPVVTPAVPAARPAPATFLFATTDDGTVPVMNSVMFYSALVKAKLPAEMHLFQHGGHGAGLATTNSQLSVWPDLLIKWMRERGFAAKE